MHTNLQQIAVLWLGTVALTIQFVGLYWSVQRYREDEPSLEGLIAYAFGLVFWAAFAMHSTNYLHITNTGTEITQSSQTLFLIGLLGGATCVVLLLDASFRVLKSA